MPIYEYRALGKDGKSKTGILDADTPKDARNKLRGQGIHVIALVEIQGVKQSRRLPFFGRRNLADLAMVTRQLATLLESGIQLREAIGALIEQIEDRSLQTAYRDIREKITGGKSFADALGDHPFYFNPLYVNMVRAGEAAGTLDAILNKVADYLQAQTRMQGKISAALAYPLVMVVIGTGVVIFLMTFVVPKITNVLLSQGKTLPLPTEILVAISNFLLNWWWLLLGVAISLYIAYRLVKATTWGKRQYDLFMISLPVLGILFKKQAVSRFAITFSTLLQSGIPALECLHILRNVVDNEIMAETLDEVSKTIIEGGEIAAPLRRSKVFPPLVGYMIAVGEKAGRLEPILTKIAEAYDEEIEVTSQKVTSLLEPLMIVTLAAIVGFIVLSIILPIMELSQI
jgi:general secretion pathway protein F